VPTFVELLGSTTWPPVFKPDWHLCSWLKLLVHIFIQRLHLCMGLYSSIWG